MGGVIIHFAILVEPNPGPGVRAMIATDAAGNVIYSRAQHLGYERIYSNNELSYKTLIACLEWAIKNCYGEPVEISTEQELLVNQISNVWACRAENLRPLHEKAGRLLRQANATLRLIPARDNSECRLLCRMAANEARQVKKGRQANAA
jgi:ribonuclease HI